MSTPNKYDAVMKAEKVIASCTNEKQLLAELAE